MVEMAEGQACLALARLGVRLVRMGFDPSRDAVMIRSTRVSALRCNRQGAFLHT
jgi:hypothetical protein